MSQPLHPELASAFTPQQAALVQWLALQLARALGAAQATTADGVEGGVGRYQIAGLLGSGGMAQVYRAVDPKLGREVAVKVLRPQVRGDPDQVRRFEHEARATASVDHPNVVAIHDIGSHGGQPFIVTELLEGQTLRQRLTAGPLPLREALDIAVQASRGLAAAHARGIVHRDIKPDNLFVTTAGCVKILDFGIAKPCRPRRGPASGVWESTPLITAPGSSPGTPAYMSPEQVRGATLAAPSDLFSLGAVVYEMLTGRAAFRRATAAESLAAVLRDEAEFLHTDGVPPAVRAIVDRCLRKRPGARYQGARDLLEALEAAAPPWPADRVCYSPRIGSRRAAAARRARRRA